jgi:hypothetical protein
MVVLETPFSIDPRETGCSNLPDQIVQFCCFWELDLASVLISSFFPWALSCSTATSSRPLSMLRAASLLVKVSPLGPVRSRLLPEPSAEDSDLRTNCLHCCPKAYVLLGETRWSNFGSRQFSFPVPGSSCPVVGRHFRHDRLLHGSPMTKTSH